MGAIQEAESKVGLVEQMGGCGDVDVQATDSIGATIWQCGSGMAENIKTD